MWGDDFFKFLMKILRFQHIAVLDYAFHADLKEFVLHSIHWRFPDKSNLPLYTPPYP